MNWQVPRMWEDGDVWIIGGGPSVTKEFGIPDEVVQSVAKGQSPPNVYSPYMSFLHDKHIIGINVAYMLGNWVDMVFFGDKGFYLANQNGLALFPNLRVSCLPSMGNNSWIKCLPRDTEHARGISTSPKLVSWNGNSGAAAISVAAWAGAKRIILLGFDMKLSPTKTQHWHNLYGRGEIKEDKKLMALPFARHLRGFDQIAKDARKMGIEILNCSPESTITQFPKYSLKELMFDNT